MPTFSGRFEYLAPGRGREQEGPCQVSFDAETLTIVGRAAPLGFDLGDIDIFDAGEYELRLSLYTGAAVRLAQFGKTFQDLRADLLGAYRDRLVKCLLVSDLDETARFTGRVTLDSPTRACSGQAELRLYESNLAVLPDAAAGFQWRLSEIGDVEFDESRYAVSVVSDGERLSIGHLAKRTGEFVERLNGRRAALGERSAKALRALFPFLAPDEFRRLAALLVEGRSTPIRQLRTLHRLVEPTLATRLLDGKLRPYFEALAGRSVGREWYAGFKIIRSEDEPAVEEAGAGGERDPAAQDAPPTAAIDVGDGLEFLAWFFFPLSSGGGPPTHAAWETTSRTGRATYVFRLPAGGSLDEQVAAINRGLVALNFRREPVYLDDDTLDSELRYRHYAIARRKVPELALVREGFVGRGIHASVPAWTAQIDRLLG
jgi:hypothetical protein